MSKLSIGHGMVEVETREKTNVMSSCNTMSFIICTIGATLILFSSEQWIKILGAAIIVIFVIAWLIIYAAHSIKSPHLLQSEKYRLEMQKIEAGMIEDKKEILQIEAEPLQTNALTTVDNDLGDNDE